MKQQVRFRFNKPTTGMNKTEAKYAQILDLYKRSGVILEYWYESLKFRLADRTWYTPDFFIIRADGIIEVVEIKGFLRDDAAVKFKTARSEFPYFTWEMKRLHKGQWEDVYGTASRK